MTENIKSTSNKSSLANKLRDIMVAKYADIKTVNISKVDVKNASFIISGLTEELLTNLEIFSDNYCSLFNSHSIKLRNICVSTNNHKNITSTIFNKPFNNSVEILNYQKKPTSKFIKPFSIPIFENGTLNIHNMVDIYTDLSLLLPPTYGHKKTYKIRLKFV